MRLGGPVFEAYDSPDDWVAALRALGYRAAYCPVAPTADEATIRAYADAARRADIVIAEVGCWSNPLSNDPAERQEAMVRCKQGLALADKIGARCAVNIAGSRGPRWDGPHPANFSVETFDMIVATVREVIDDVRPVRTFYTLETMPWIFPDSPDSYLDLINAIDRPRFAVHLDPVNLVTSPRRYYATDSLVRECVGKLGPHIRSCHAKDIILRDQWTVHLDEIRPGQGGFDYPTLLRELDGLDPDTPLMLEHLATAEAYELAAQSVRDTAKAVGVSL